MTPQQIQLLKQSWEGVKPKASQLAEFFYYHLFDANPEFRVLFKGSFYEQQQKFIRMLDMIIAHANQLSVIEDEIVDSGKRHKGYGVKQADYAPVGAALLYALQNALKKEWTSEHTEAWTAAYTIISAKMLST
jgi:hemoglobin-like flavoprotein